MNKKDIQNGIEYRRRSRRAVRLYHDPEIRTTAG